MNRKNKWSLFAIVCIGLAIFAYSLKDIPFHVIRNEVAELKWGWLAAAFLCMVISLLFEGLVVYVLLHKQKPSFNFRAALRVPLIEQLFNGITPFQSGGQPAQLFALLQSGIDVGRASSSMLMKFVVYQAMIVVCFVISLLAQFHFLAAKLHALALLVIFGFLVHFFVITGLLLIMYWHSLTKKLVNFGLWPVKRWGKKATYEHYQTVADEKIDNFYQESLRLKKDPRLLIKIGLLTLCQLFFYYVIPYFILLALHVSRPNIFLVLGMHILIVMIISLFPLPGGMGGAEFSFSVIFSTFLTQNSKVVFAMVLWRLITYYFGMALGMGALAVKPQQKKR
ncbi:membrane protein [Ligilactobacillus salitolerans]|uniref:Phosphatidylglycerol lysyltransferase n=1 Tax=Ligilactobacillus salitolerans TaxID=1808352 RepID=A0A401IV95_9LACO|nr:lysylphosphatidylglycerol synthase transmembrane domain-containing protein [Ligilactobacillus salitolerans]GBG95418.1 membrane protein [Ligilactobacillus salitolerans]